MTRFFTILLSLLLATVAMATEFVAEETITINEPDTVRANLVLTGKSVNVQSNVDGDVIAAARYVSLHGETLGNIMMATQTGDIMKSVHGDLLLFGQYLNVRADTTGDIRGLGQSLSVHGVVDGDILFGGDDIFIGPDAVVTGDLIVGCDRLEILGDVQGRVRAGSETFILQGEVHDVELWSDQITITGDGRVLGDITYHRHESDDGGNWHDRVEGSVSHLGLKDPEDKDSDGFGFLFGLYLLGTAVATSLILVLVWRHGVAGSVAALESKRGPSILSGLLAVAATPVIAVIAMALLLTLPLGLILLFFYPVMLYLGWIMFGVWVGKFVLDGLLKRDVSLWAAAPFGVFLLGILGYVPFIGWVIGMVSTIGGVGMLLVQLHSMREARVW